MFKRMLIILSIIMIITLTSCSPSYNQLKVANERLIEENNRLEAAQQALYDLFSDISLEVVKANVMIYTNCYKTVLGIKYKVVGGQGSGVIIKEENGYYYALTNNHVVYGNPEYPTREYKIYDYKMNEYIGKCLYSDAKYDLALVRFTKNIDLQQLPLALNDPIKGDMVIAIGQPEGQLNAITFGKIKDYIIPNCTTCNKLESDVQFACIYHDAYTFHGNSGGMLINDQKKIVGINTFGSETNNHGLSIPVSKIKEFLTINNFIFN